MCRGLGSSVGDSSDGQFGSFVDGLGPGQIVGRQVLGSPCMGEVQLSIADRKSQLEVEVIRARALGAKPGAKVLPGLLCSSQLRLFLDLFITLLFHLQISCGRHRFMLSVAF